MMMKMGWTSLAHVLYLGPPSLKEADPEQKVQLEEPRLLKMFRQGQRRRTLLK